MNTLKENHSQEIERILGKYPPDQKRAAVMPLLYLAQGHEGYLSKTQVEEIAELVGVSSTDVASLLGFYTLYHDRPAGRFRVQVCNDLPCALRGADQFLEELCANLAIRLGETTADGRVTVEAVMCLAACDKAPMFQVQSPKAITYYENQSVESALALIEGLGEEADNGTVEKLT